MRDCELDLRLELVVSSSLPPSSGEVNPASSCSDSGLILKRETLGSGLGCAYCRKAGVGDGGGIEVKTEFLP